MSTSSTVAFYKGYYAGGKPVVLSANPFDVAQDLSTGNLWQYTGAAWVAPSWQTSITFWLGAGDSVCARLNSEDTRIPDTIQVYYGTDDQVPAELALSADDVAIHHGVGNYNIAVNVLRSDVTTDTVVDVPFPEGYIISTDDGNWTILKNFTKCVGYDYATVSLAWTTTADGQGPQSVDYVTSAEARDIAEDVVSSGGVAVNIEGGNGINVITSGGSSVVEFSGAAQFVNSDTDDVTTLRVTPSGLSVAYIQGPISKTFSVADNVYVDDVIVATEAYVDSAISQIPIVSGALTSGAEFVTQVGDYTLSYTSGGLVVSGSGASVVLSGGEIAAGVTGGGGSASFSVNSSGFFASAGDEGHDAVISMPVDGDVSIIADGAGRSLKLEGTGEVQANNEAVATQPWVEDYVSSHGGQSGAIIENQPFATTVGTYTVALTSGGGIVVSGSGASVVLSGGKIAAKNTYSDTSDNPVDATFVFQNGEVNYNINDPDLGSASLAINTQNANVTINGKKVYLDGDDFTVDTEAVATEPWANSRFSLKPSETDDDVSSEGDIRVLNGGDYFVYQQPLYSLIVDSVAKSTEASYIHFTLDSVTAPTPVVISGVSYLNTAIFEGGKEYLLRFFDGMLETREVLDELEPPVDGQTGVWLKSGGLTLASRMTMKNATVGSGESQSIYNRGTASDTTVTGGGLMAVYSGGSAVSPVFNQSELAPAANGIVSNGGVMVSAEIHKSTYVSVTLGGSMADASLVGGLVYISSGGIAARISGGVSGIVHVRGGSLISAKIHSGMSWFVSSGGTATEVVASGVLTVDNGGITSTVVEGAGGAINVALDAVASSTTINGGTFRVSSGGTALGVDNISGSIFVFDGGTLNDLAHHSGDIRVNSGGIVSRMTLYSGARLIVSSGGTALAVTSQAGATVVNYGYVDYVTP